MNTVLMQLRKKRLPQTSLGEVLDSGEGTLWSRNTLGVVDRALGHTNIRIDRTQAINQILTGFKVVLFLHDVEDYRHAEISIIHGWSPGTSKSTVQLYKARRRLRELLGDPRRDVGSLFRAYQSRQFEEI